MTPTWLLDTLEALLSPSAEASHICVGYSGGLDSHVLLHALAMTYPRIQTQTQPELPEQPSHPVPSKFLHAIHVHHGLHPEADRWVLHCQTVCKRLGVPLTVCYATPQDFPNHSPEAAARVARYQAFASHLTTGDVLVLAHHLDDQAETLLHRLFRGTGVLGLAGMQAYVPGRSTYALVRPLLNVPRAELSEYAKAHHLQWIEDSSNQDERFDRNFIRHQLLPLIQQRWPEAPQALSRTALLCRAAQQSLEEQAKPDLTSTAYVSESLRRRTVPEKWLLKEATALASAIGGEGLSVTKLLVLPSSRRREAFRLWLHEKGLYSPSLDQMQRVEREILGAAPGGNPRLKLPNYEIRRWRDLLFVCRV